MTFLFNQRYKQVNNQKYSCTVQALARMKQNNALYLTIYRSLVAQLNKLSLNQISIITWSMIKTKQTDKSTFLAVYKKIHSILQNAQSVLILQSNKQIPEQEADSLATNQYQQSIQTNKIHYIHESNYVHLIWSLIRSKIIDQKIILQFLKKTLQDKQCKNLQKIRIENVCLLAYCITELQFEKYRISQLIILRIVQKWQHFQKLSTLSLVLLCQSFSKFTQYQSNYLERYQQKIQLEQLTKKQELIKKIKSFIFIVVETIFLKQNKQINRFRGKQTKRRFYQNYTIKRLSNPLSTKFASQILFNLSRVNLYERSIWFKLLTSICDSIDQAQVQDLSMTLTALCKINTKQMGMQDSKEIIFQHKKIICTRLFQIYTSLSGQSLKNLKQLIHSKHIQNELVPSRIRKQIQKQFMEMKVEKQTAQNQKQQTKNADQQSLNQEIQKQSNLKERRQLKTQKKDLDKKYQQQRTSSKTNRKNSKNKNKNKQQQQQKTSEQI